MYAGGWSVENRFPPGLEAAGDGEMGVRGATPGDLRDNDERVFCAAEMLKDSLGLAARAAYIVEDGN